MAHQEQVELLASGVSVWNSWRAEHPDVYRLDLSGADLSEAHLDGANLSGADLSGARLRGAHLYGASLGRANLSGADLHEAHLTGANLTGADLHGADLGRAGLWGADLSRADLHGATLWEATLREANLTEADPSEAGLTPADLTKAQLDRANLRMAQLQGARLEMASLRYVVLQQANLTGANLFGAYLSWAKASEAVFQGANLFGVYLKGADLQRADLRGADLRLTNFSWTDIRAVEHLASINPLFAIREGANLSEADLRGANLSGADLSQANLQGANLSGANLSWAQLSGADLRGADLSWSCVYAASAWNVHLEGATQSNLIITNAGPLMSPDDLLSERDRQAGLSAEEVMPEVARLAAQQGTQPQITVDNLEVAQFIHLLLNHQRLRDVFDTVTERGVLLLGRFGSGGLEVLHALASALRASGYLPMIFDFSRPTDRNYTETVKTLVGLSRFVIADLSGPSVPQELYATVPHFKIPFVPIIEADRKAFAMAVDLLEYPWVVRPPVAFADVDELLALAPSRIIAPAEAIRQARQRLLDELFHPEG